MFNSKSVKRFGLPVLGFCVIATLLSGCEGAVEQPAPIDPKPASASPSASVAQASSATAPSVNTELEELLLAPPPGWHIAASVAFKDFRRAVFIPPQDETVTDASQTDKAIPDQELLIVEGFPIGQATRQQTDPLEFSAALAKHEQAICKTFADQSTYAGIERGFPSAVRLFLCTGRGTGGNRLTLVKTMRGDHMFYLVARQLRTEEDIGEDNPKAAAERLATWSLHLRGVGMCSRERDDQGKCTDATDGAPSTASGQT